MGLSQIEPEKFCLPDVKVGFWGGFVFINLDPDAGPLEDQLDGIAEHFVTHPLEDRYKSAHVAKLVRANWKAVHEAFIESYHLLATHPQPHRATATRQPSTTSGPASRTSAARSRPRASRAPI